jgi:hypothetical protein
MEEEYNKINPRSNLETHIQRQATYPARLKDEESRKKVSRTLSKRGSVVREHKINSYECIMLAIHANINI